MSVSLEQYQQKINSSQNILIAYGEKAKLPQAACATALYLWLKQQGKQVTIVSPTSPIVEFCHLVGINKVKTALPQENLVITFPYNETKIDRILSELNPDRNQLSVIIKPQKGQPPLKTTDLHISYHVADYDLLFFIDIRSPKELARLVGQKVHPWTKPEPLITCNSFASPAPIKAELTEVLGKNTGFASYWGKLFQRANTKLGVDAASNLLMGLEVETANFHHDDDPELFELAAWLLRQGATRFRPDQEFVAKLDPLHHLPSTLKRPQASPDHPASPHSSPTINFQTSTTQ